MGELVAIGSLVGQAKSHLGRANAALEEGTEDARAVLADLTAVSAEQLRARAVYDDRALNELARRGELAVAA